MVVLVVTRKTYMHENADDELDERALVDAAVEHQLRVAKRELQKTSARQYTTTPMSSKFSYN